MKIAPLFCLSSILLAGLANAEEYQSFGSVSYMKQEESYKNYFPDYTTEDYNLNWSYYFAPRASKGPLNEFDFINTLSYVGAGVSHSDSGSTYENVGGEYISGHFGVGAAVTFDEDEYTSHFIKGTYFVNDDLALGGYYYDVKDGDSGWVASAAYDYALNASDYIGFSVDYTDNDYVEVMSVHSKYFNALSNGDYLVLAGSYADYFEDGYDNYWDLTAKYYISKYTGFSVNYDKDERYGAGVIHYLNSNIALSLDYSNYEGDFYESDTYTLTLAVQY